MDSGKKSNIRKHLILVTVGIFVITIILFSCLRGGLGKQNVDSFDISYNSTLFAMENKNAYYPVFINNSPKDAELLFSIHNDNIDKNISIQLSTGAIIIGKNISIGTYPLEILVVSGNSNKYMGEKIIDTTIIVVDTEKSVRDVSRLMFAYPETDMHSVMVIDKVRNRLVKLLKI